MTLTKAYASWSLGVKMRLRLRLMTPWAPWVKKQSSALQVRNSLQIDRSDVAGGLLAVLAVGAAVFTVIMVGQFLGLCFAGICSCTSRWMHWILCRTT